jgi:hypothetical protein
MKMKTLAELTVMLLNQREFHCLLPYFCLCYTYTIVVLLLSLFFVSRNWLFRTDRIVSMYYCYGQCIWNKNVDKPSQILK